MKLRSSKLQDLCQGKDKAIAVRRLIFVDVGKFFILVKEIVVTVYLRLLHPILLVKHPWLLA
jgi:hypothetical protein